MRILLDTCTYIWFLIEPEKLSKKAIALIEDKENTLFLSAISLWEINIKVKLNKLKIKGDEKTITDIKMFEDIFQPVNFTPEDALQILKLPARHNDPFDLMLICQTITNSFTILTPDRQIKKYNIKTLW